MNIYEKSDWNIIGRRPGKLILTEKLIAKSGCISGKALDIGCGEGESCRYLSQKGFETYGIDSSNKLIDKAKNKNPNLKFIIQNGEGTSFLSEQFDILLCECTYSELNNCEKEFYRLLKTDGLLLLSDIYDKTKSPLEKLLYSGFELIFFQDEQKFFNDFVMEMVWNGILIDCFLEKSECMEKRNLGYYSAILRKRG